MTSMIFGAIYMSHQATVGAYRDKQRRKAYERWEGLRDDYDAQKKISRETQSLDLQRTGLPGHFVDDRPIATLRDLQEANDARTSWRPQESWEASPHAQQSHSPSQSQSSLQARSQSVAADALVPQYTQQQVTSAAADPLSRSVSVPSTYWAGRGEIKPQRTGFAWDDELPAPLRVSRRSYDGDEFNPYSSTRNSSISLDANATLPPDTRASLQSVNYSNASSRQSSRSSSQIRSKSSAVVPAVAHPSHPPLHHLNSAPAAVSKFNIEPVESELPGGPMAQLVSMDIVAPQPTQPLQHGAAMPYSQPLSLQQTHQQPPYHPHLQHQYSYPAAIPPPYQHNMHTMAGGPMAHLIERGY